MGSGRSENARSTVSASELQITLTDYDQRERPYDGPALRIRITGDLAFVYLGTLKEERGKETFEFEDNLAVGVDAEALYEALGAMLRCSDRQAHERLREGTLPADHPSLRVERTTSLVPATRRRA